MWAYDEAARLLTVRAVRSATCIYCRHTMHRIPAEEYKKGEKRLLAQLSLCPQCGWWTVFRVHQGNNLRTSGVEGYSGAIGSLVEFDIDDASTPVTMARQYLLARSTRLSDVHPRLLEEIVGSVFADLGWSARVTAYTGDGGIDVILDDTGGRTIGVQVRRQDAGRRIEAEAIRSLAGALLLNGHTKGVFVTTSSFRRGAKSTAREYTSLGYPIELVDAKRFLEALGVAQLKAFTLDRDRCIKYVLSEGTHLGSGLAKPLARGETLCEREPVAQLLLVDEFIDLATRA